MRVSFPVSSSSWARTWSGSASASPSTRRTTLSSRAAWSRCSGFRSALPHCAACRAARCSSSSVASENSCVMSTCSALCSGTTLLRPALLRPASPDAPSSKNLLKKSSKRLPPPRGDPPGRERPPLTSAACTLHKCSILGGSPGVMRLMAKVAGLTPHTSHILVAIFDSLPSLNVLCFFSELPSSLGGYLR